ncbi:MAG: phage capsid protein, partial [Belnapia sp.]|nr:phage capsid protein [Belnapia sp.]
APRLAAAPAILRLAADTGTPPEAAAATWAAVGTDFQIEALRLATIAARAPGAFGPRARAALLADLGAIQSKLAAARLRGMAPADAAVAALARDAALAGDLPAIGVATRALAALA